MRKKPNLTGQRFARLLVLEEANRNKWGQAMWKCQCSCPNKTIKIICGGDLRSGHTKSCGCYKREMTSKRMEGKNHPMYGKPGYWAGKKNPDQSERMKGKKHPSYKHGLTGTKEYACAIVQKRKARKLNQTPQDADINTIQEIYRLCAELNDTLGQGSFHVDHTTSLSKGGLHHENNLMIIPAHENRIKHAKNPRKYYGRYYNFMTGGK